MKCWQWHERKDAFEPWKRRSPWRETSSIDYRLRSSFESLLQRLVRQHGCEKEVSIRVFRLSLRLYVFLFAPLVVIPPKSANRSSLRYIVDPVVSSFRSGTRLNIRRKWTS